MTREIDAMVAEKVMDLRVRKVIVSEWVRERDYADPGDYVIDWSSDSASSMCPAYTTDLNAAWQAADHFAERYGCTIRVERHTKMRYVATVQGGNIAYDRADCALGVGSNEGPAHALCQVMLQARVLTEEEMFV